MKKRIQQKRGNSLFFSIGLILFVVAAIAVIHLFLGKVLGLSAEQINTISGIGEVIVSLGAAILIIYQLEQGKNIELEESGIEEAQFILQYNQFFIQDPKMTKVESVLEKYMNGSDRSHFLDDVNRQDYVNYLVYLECMATQIFRDTISIEHCDDLMAYRFFLAVNNPELQEKEIFPYANYYLGCLKLYRRWKQYRKANGLTIPMDQESPLDRWVEYETCIRQGTCIRSAACDELPEVAEVLYHTDPYIYPAAFGDAKTARKMFPNMVGDTGVFQKKGIYVAVVDRKIVGVLSMFSEAEDDADDYLKAAEGVKGVPSSFAVVCQTYFGKLADYVKEQDDSVYISCICVREENRGMKIGEQLLKYALDVNAGKKVYLHVLSDNAGAIALYKKYGFTVLAEEDGFSLSERKPRCFYMICDTEKEYYLCTKRKF